MNESLPTSCRRERFRARLLLLAAAALWSTSGLIIKSPPLAALPAETRGPLLACYRALFAAGVLLPFVRREGLRWRMTMLPMAIAFASMNVLFVTAMTMTTAAAAIFLQYTCTVWAFVLGVVALRERVDPGNLAALACALVGIVFIVAGDWSGENFAGNLIALGSGFSLAIVYVCLRQLRQENATWLTVLNHAVAGLVLLPWIASMQVSLNATQWLLVALLGVFQMGVPYVLFTRGVRQISAQEASLIALSEPVLNPIWVWAFWKEPVGDSTLIGGSLILGGLALRYLLFPLMNGTLTLRNRSPAYLDAGQSRSQGRLSRDSPRAQRSKAVNRPP